MTKRPKPPNNLIRAIKKRKWDIIHQYLHEAKLKDDDTDGYALHNVCSDSTAPMDIVADIYKEYPGAAFARDRSHDTPISIAVDINFENAVHFLAKSCPEAISISSHINSSPIQAAVDKLKSNTMIDSILDANPEAAFIPDEEGASTFGDFFQFWNSSMRLVVQNQNINEKTLDTAIGHGNWTIRDVYQKSCLFLKAGSSLMLGKNHAASQLALHSSLKFESCHYAFCKLILKLHPEQALKRDFDGNLPLHIILSSQEGSDKEALLCMDCLSSESKLMHIEYENGMADFCCKDCFQYLEYKSKKLEIKRVSDMEPEKKVLKMVKELITMVPQMAFIPDIRGNYPLHLAIQNQQSFEIVYRLYNAFVELGTMEDVTTRLLPFMLAAVGYWKNEEDQISIIFQLLREEPHLIN